MCIHGPVGKGVLADIVLVDPHMQACSHCFMVLGLAARLTHAERGVWLMPNNYPLVDPPDKIAGALSIMQ